ncbi:serine/threonine-protein kinase [Nonomuraea gerenzanensis]|uniref:non-specific serine/threonine protein kinase n=1 Tax=Nonomuraea gerenzanensis TaxID=93944 RepID=A0A1M4EA98_9ACTN|nr:serine/threonine-protein kinase [Nonomuraea gerenzanensis]UBU17890.1 serine/threonine protein kinase [Nonomuraea gerenzanensis]SBO95682.1 serine/threonine protein kinase [Nonomuraea gerenzanensis]
MSAACHEGRLLAGRYRLESELGKGGMGRVWQGHDELLDRPVAVKEVTLEHQPPSEREVLLGRTMTEARLAARLSHPHIAAVYDVVVADGQPWIVLQLVSAPTLADVLAERGSLPPATVAGIGLQVLEALQVAHAAGVVHRDVKPANILLDSAGPSALHDLAHHAVLTDFGLATSTEQPVGLTQAGIVVGTPAYIAPERARGGPATPQSDLWSLGVTLYTAVEGRCPFEQGTALATISAVLTADPAPFRRAGSLAPLIAGLLDKDPDRRTGIAEARRFLDRLVARPATAVPETGDLLVPPLEQPPATNADDLPPVTNTDDLPLVTSSDDPPPLTSSDDPPPVTSSGELPPVTSRPPAAAGACTARRPPYVRHAVVVTTLAAGVLVAGFWPDDAPSPAPAMRQHSVTATPLTDPPTPPPTRVLLAERVESRDRLDAPPKPAATPAPQPGGGTGGKARGRTGHLPPGHAAGHPGQGQANGRK